MSWPPEFSTSSFSPRRALTASGTSRMFSGRRWAVTTMSVVGIGAGDLFGAGWVAAACCAWAGAAIAPSATALTSIVR